MRAAPAVRSPSDVLQLAAEADLVWWRHAASVADAVVAEERAQGPAAGRRRLDDLVAPSGLDRNTIRKRVAAVRWLRDAGLDLAGAVPIGLAVLVATDRSVGDAEKKALLAELVAAARAGGLPDREQVRRRLRARRPASRIPAREEMGGDLWWFDRCDPAFGREGPDRIPGQAFRNLIDRFLPAGGRVLSAMAGDGTVLDVAAVTPKVGAYSGFDHAVDPDVERRHAGHVTIFDPTEPDWGPLGLHDMVILTPPFFSFTGGVPTCGALPDLDAYVATLERVIHGAATALVGGGVFVLATRHTADFGERDPVPNLVHQLTSIVEDAVGEVFLGAPVVGHGPRRKKAHAGAWLVPTAVHILVYRKTA